MSTICGECHAISVNNPCEFCFKRIKSRLATAHARVKELEAWGKTQSDFLNWLRHEDFIEFDGFPQERNAMEEQFVKAHTLGLVEG